MSLKNDNSAIAGPKPGWEKALKPEIATETVNKSITSNVTYRRKGKDCEQLDSSMMALNQSRRDIQGPMSRILSAKTSTYRFQLLQETNDNVEEQWAAFKHAITKPQRKLSEGGGDLNVRSGSKHKPGIWLTREKGKEQKTASKNRCWKGRSRISVFRNWSES